MHIPPPRSAESNTTQAQRQDVLLAHLTTVAELLAEAPIELQGAALLFRARDGMVRRVLVGEKLTCGRTANCELQFPKEIREISGRHFTVIRQGSVYWLVDEGSTNGTMVRGCLVQKHELRDGDLIDAGGVLFAFVRE